MFIEIEARPDNAGWRPLTTYSDPLRAEAYVADCRRLAHPPLRVVIDGQVVAYYPGGGTPKAEG